MEEKKSKRRLPFRIFLPFGLIALIVFAILLLSSLDLQIGFGFQMGRGEKDGNQQNPSGAPPIATSVSRENAAAGYNHVYQFILTDKKYVYLRRNPSDLEQFSKFRSDSVRLDTANRDAFSAEFRKSLTEAASDGCVIEIVIDERNAEVGSENQLEQEQTEHTSRGGTPFRWKRVEKLE